MTYWDILDIRTLSLFFFTNHVCICGRSDRLTWTRPSWLRLGTAAGSDGLYWRLERRPHCPEHHCLPTHTWRQFTWKTANMNHSILPFCIVKWEHNQGQQEKLNQNCACLKNIFQLTSQQQRGVSRVWRFLLCQCTWLYLHHHPDQWAAAEQEGPCQRKSFKATY